MPSLPDDPRPLYLHLRGRIAMNSERPSTLGVRSARKLRVALYQARSTAFTSHYWAIAAGCATIACLSGRVIRGYAPARTSQGEQSGSLRPHQASRSPVARTLSGCAGCQPCQANLIVGLVIIGRGSRTRSDPQHNCRLDVTETLVLCTPITITVTSKVHPLPSRAPCCGQGRPQGPRSGRSTRQVSGARS